MPAILLRLHNQQGLLITVLDRICGLVAPLDANFKYLIVSRPTLDRAKESSQQTSLFGQERARRQNRNSPDVCARGVGQRNVAGLNARPDTRKKVPLVA